MSVYFIQPEGEPVVKIGYANSVFGRISALQVSHHRRLILVGLIDRGDWHDEGSLHSRFAKLHIRGEWFALGDELLAFLASLPPPPAMPEPYPLWKPGEFNTDAPLYKAWFSTEFETDEDMAWEWQMDAGMLREELGESGRPHE